jgi:Spy/CpxP family protein refolding chaperone
MRKLTIITAIAILTIGAAFAQVKPDQGIGQKGVKQGQHQRGKHHGMHGKFGKLLNLTEAQKTKLKAIHQETRKQLKALRASDGPVEAKKAQAKQIRENGRAYMRSVLTPEQIQKLDQLKANHKGKAGKTGRRPGGAKGKIGKGIG